MTEQVKKLIDSAKVYSLPAPIRYEGMCKEVVTKADLERIVGELTMLHSSEDGLPHEVIAGNRQYVRKDLALEFATRFYQLMTSARVDEYIGARKNVCVNDLFEEFLKTKEDEKI